MCFVVLIMKFNKSNEISNKQQVVTLKVIFYNHTFFNRSLNRGCLVHMFSLRFSGSKFLINLRRQFRVRKFFVHKFLRILQSFHFVFKITIMKMRNLCYRLLFY